MGEEEVPKRVRPEQPENAKPQAAGETFHVDAADADLVDMPAPSAETFFPKNVSTTRSSTYRSLGLRRTMVPILLTSGVGLPVLAVMWFLTDADSPFRNTGIGLPIALIITGGILLAVGILNVIFLRNELREREQHPSRI
jgi:hypothetical protein